MRLKNLSHGRDRGFTLIEVMVVIAIIASLIGAGSLMIGIAMKKRAVTTTQGRLNALGAALEQIRSQDQLGRYPPTMVSKLSVQGFDGAKFGGQPNATNLGIETLWVAFHLPGITVKPQGVDDALDNTDDDKAIAPAGQLQKPDLFEYVDAWGNPLIYINATDYKNADQVDQYVLGDGKQTSIKVPPKKNEKSGEYIRPDSYQLMSLGPDGLPDTADDIMFGSM